MWDPEDSVDWFDGDDDVVLGCGLETPDGCEACQ